MLRSSHRVGVFRHILLAVSAALLLSCGGDSTESAVEDTGTGSGSDPDPTPVSEEWRAITLESAIDKVQPMTGIVLWADDHNDTILKSSDQYVQLEYAYVRPCDVVAGQSQYDWSALESLLDDVAARGHQAVLRWYYVYPGDETRVPDYIKALPDYRETSGRSEGQMTDFPDWTHAEMERFHLEFYSRFAERYDTDPRIAFLQAGFGLWAEYHIYDGPNTIGEQFPSKAFQTIFLNHLDTVFDTLHWSISIDAGDGYYSPIMASGELQSLAFGMFDDSFMHETHDEYNEEMWDLFDHLERYKHSPHGGELSYYRSYDQAQALNPDGMYGRTYEELSATFHITYMIGNDQPQYRTNERIKSAGMANGYKFRIIDFRATQSQSRVTVANTGIAPIYYDAYVTVNGVRAQMSLKGLLPSQNQEFLVASGGNDPVLTIECDRLVQGQAIQFEADLTGD